MNITNRLYTYPVLSEMRDDYINSSFQATVSTERSTVSNLVLDFRFKLDNKEIKNLMFFEKRAQFVVHIECPTTSFRKVIFGDVRGEFSYEIPYKDINGKIEMVAFVIATKDIKQFKCDDWNEDFEGLSFDISKGSVLAFINLNDLIIKKDDQDLMNSSSIFSIYKRNTDERRPAEIELNGDKIKIGLCTKEYNLYNKYSAIDSVKALVNSLIVLPVLVYVFEELRQEYGEENYKERAWYISLTKAYKKEGISLKEILVDDTKSSFECAQEAMDLPLSLALENLDDLFASSEEETE